MEFINPEGLRVDGRRPKELRRLKCELGTLANANGSAVFEIGHTKASHASVCGREGSHFCCRQDALPCRLWKGPVRSKVRML